jgi:hypothetical protein
MAGELFPFFDDDGTFASRRRAPWTHDAASLQRFEFVKKAIALGSHVLPLSAENDWSIHLAIAACAAIEALTMRAWRYCRVDDGSLRFRSSA